LRQAHRGHRKAALLLLVVDSQAGLRRWTRIGSPVAQYGKPFFMAVNKVDSPRQESNRYFPPFRGAGVPITRSMAPVVDDLLDAAIALVSGALIDAGRCFSADAARRAGPVEIQLSAAERWQSTLLNRMVVKNLDCVSVRGRPWTRGHRGDRDGRVYRFVDTAAIRERIKTNLVGKKLSVVMARAGLNGGCGAAVVDSEHGVTQGDAQIAS